MKDVKDYILTKNITVGQTQQWIKDKDENAKTKLIDLIHHRFYNRYLKHLEFIDSSFLRMGVSCLMIETIESFHQGKKDTKGIGKDIFRDFFTRQEQFFPGFKEIENDQFYQCIRCGILHQAETTKGWRLVRSGELLNRTGRVINGEEFVKALGKTLDNYVQTLKENGFESEIWKNAILKLEDVCENCKFEPYADE